jgi:MFS superfamily sulfate permease-like transporter
MVFLETTAVARAIRTQDEPAIDSDREIFAVGAASLAGSFFHSLPAAGGFSQSELHAHVVEIRRRDDGSWAAVDDETAAGSDLDAPDVLVLRVTAPLYTANVRASSDAIADRCRQRRPAVVVVDALALGRLSVTVLDAVKELDRELTAEGSRCGWPSFRRPHWPPFGVLTGGRSGSTKAASTPA